MREVLISVRCIKQSPLLFGFGRGQGVNAGVCTESMSARDLRWGLQGKAIFRMLCYHFFKKRCIHSWGILLCLVWLTKCFYNVLRYFYHFLSDERACCQFNSPMWFHWKWAAGVLPGGNGAGLQSCKVVMGREPHHMDVAQTELYWQSCNTQLKHCCESCV